MAVQRIEASIDVGKLKKLLEAATRGPWSIDRGMMSNDLRITAYEREGFDRHDGDGAICYVSTERLHFDHDKDHFGNFKGESRSWRTPIKKASADAELIVAAVNALPEMIRRAKLDIDETAWLIEWPADRHGPIRYWSPGEAPVIGANDACRFSREADAKAIIRVEKLRGCNAVEHMWLAPKKAKAS